MKQMHTWFGLWNGLALKGRHTRRILRNLYVTALMLISLMLFTSGMMTDFGLAEGYHLLAFENVLSIVAILAMLGMMETSLAERQGLALNLAQSDLEQFHSSYGFGLIGTVMLLILIQVLAFFINGIFFDVWKGWQEILTFIVRCLSLYLLCMPMKYSKDFRMHSVGNSLMFVVIMILGRVGNHFVREALAFWGILFIVSAVYSYGLGIFLHCRHGKTQKE